MNVLSTLSGNQQPFVPRSQGQAVKFMTAEVQTKDKGWWGGVSKRGLIQWGTGGQVREDCMSGESKVCCTAVYHPVWVVCIGPTSDQDGQYITVCQYTRLYHMLVHQYVPYQCPIGTLLWTDKVNHGWNHLEDWLCNDWG